MAEATTVLEDLGGAVVVRASMPTAGWISGPGTTAAVLNRNPLSHTKGNPVMQSIVFLYELKRYLNFHLKDWATNTGINTIVDIAAFNEADAAEAQGPPRRQDPSLGCRHVQYKLDAVLFAASQAFDCSLKLDSRQNDREARIADN